jgi:thiamine pyrophosphate-dependent acetolactate synthase large subunit-like protein
MCRSSAICRTCWTICRNLEASAGVPDPKALAAWWKQIDEWRGKKSLKYKQGKEIIMPQYVVEKLYEVTGGDAFVTSDVGQHQMWAAQYYKFDKPRRWINSGGLGTMGVGLPYAMGVRFANPKATVACITGEASIQMNIQELSTASSSACRSRSSISTTATSAWCASGSRCSTATAMPSRMSTRCRISSNWPSRMGMSA